MKTPKAQSPVTVTTVEGRIHLVRGHKVILDRDLAELYGVSTKALNQAVKRNQERFPGEFVFRLTRQETNGLGTEFAALDFAEPPPPNRSQIVTGSQKHRDPRFPPYAYTEHGALMAANILRSRRAVQMSVVIVQTFVRLQRMAVSVDQLARKVEALERKALAHDADLAAVFKALKQLMTPPAPSRREIGFHTKPGNDEPNPAAPPGQTAASRSR